MPSLTLLRHVDSVWTAENRYTGAADVALSPRGIEAARRLAPSIDRLHLDLVYTSALRRTRDTLDGILSALHGARPAVEIAAELNERSFGVLEGLRKREARETHGEEAVHRWRSSFDQAPPGGESLAQTALRTGAFVSNRLLPSLRSGKNVLVVAHGDSLRTVMMALEDLSETATLALRIKPGELVHYDVIEREGLVRRSSVV